MKISRLELLKVLKQVLPGIDSGNAIEGSNSIIFDDGWVHSYNDSISISVPVPPEWKELSGAVSGNELHKMISKFKDSDLELSSGPKSLMIAGKKAEVELTLMHNAMKVRISAVLNDIEEWKAIPEDFREGVQACKFSSNSAKIAGIFVEGDSILASDNQRVNCWKMKGEMPRFWISDDCVSELLKFGELAEYFVSKSWLHVKTDNGTIFSCKRLADESWSNKLAERLLERNAYEEGDLRNTMPEGIVESVDRAAALLMDIAGFKVVGLEISPAGIEVRSLNAAGKYREKVEFDQPFKEAFDPIRVLVEPGLIKYAFDRASQFHIKSLEVGGKMQYRVMFVSDRFSHLMTTISEKAEEKPNKEKK